MGLIWPARTGRVGEGRRLGKGDGGMLAGLLRGGKGWGQKKGKEAL